MSSNGFLYNCINSILTMVRGKRIFVFAESVEDVKKARDEIDETSTSIAVFTDIKDILTDVNTHSIFKYSEGYIVEGKDKKSTGRILAALIHQSAPHIKLKTLQTHQ